MDNSISWNIDKGIEESKRFQAEKCVVCSKPARYRLYDAEDYGGCFLEDNRQLEVHEDIRHDKSKFASVWPLSVKLDQGFCSAECIYTHMKERIKELNKSETEGYVLKQDNGWKR